MAKGVIDLSGVVATIRPVNQSIDIAKAVEALERQIPAEKDEFTTGVAQGIRWAIRYLLGDKSAS